MLQECSRFQYPPDHPCNGEILFFDSHGAHIRTEYASGHPRHGNIYLPTNYAHVQTNHAPDYAAFALGAAVESAPKTVSSCKRLRDTGEGSKDLPSPKALKVHTAHYMFQQLKNDYGIFRNLIDLTSNYSAPALKAYVHCIPAPLITPSTFGNLIVHHSCHHTPICRRYNKIAPMEERVVHRRGRPLPIGFFLSKAPSGLSSVLSTYVKMVDAFTHVQLTALSLGHLCVPFEYNNRSMCLYKDTEGEVALKARRDVADRFMKRRTFRERLCTQTGPSGLAVGSITR